MGAFFCWVSWTYFGEYRVLEFCYVTVPDCVSDFSFCRHSAVTVNQIASSPKLRNRKWGCCHHVVAGSNPNPNFHIPNFYPFMAWNPALDIISGWKLWCCSSSLRDPSKASVSSSIFKWVDSTFLQVLSSREHFRGNKKKYDLSVGQLVQMDVCQVNL